MIENKFNKCIPTLRNEKSNDFSYIIYRDIQHYDVILKYVPKDRSKKIKITGVLRALSSRLHLIDAKYAVEHTPYTLGEYVQDDIAKSAKSTLEEQGCEVELLIRCQKSPML